MEKHALRIDIQADILPGPIRIKVEGCLTHKSWPSLLKILQRGTQLQGCPELVVDLMGLDHLELAGHYFLDRFITEHNHAGRSPVVAAEIPAQRYHCPAVATQPPTRLPAQQVPHLQPVEPVPQPA